MDDVEYHNYQLRLQALMDENERLRAQVAELREAVDEYKHRLHWANEELLKRGRS